ncbi:MAG: membrane protein insertion efficiency factor YidD [Thermoguttaceae bacterium]|nr:membrane protein insertion efficiency factor YidD [Thermoguttaceae bacterium]MBR5759848.1 membrane protein insertion efficiency factor YidD [Thermoguttaceae bacterium]
MNVDFNALRRICRIIVRVPSDAAIWLVRFYQTCVSPLIGPSCRFTPTCSQYCVLAIRKYGLIIGTLKTIWRILRCNPFNRGGYDPP